MRQYMKKGCKQYASKTNATLQDLHGFVVLATYNSN